MDKKEKKHVAIIGAGIIGVSTAVWLLRQGIAVTLIDRNRPGSDKAASFGNACILAAVSVTPVTGPGLVSKSPKMLLDPDFPLFLRWSYLPKLTPWLMKYLSHANEKDTSRIAAGLAPLTSDTVEQHKALAQGTAAEAWVKDTHYSFVYPTRKDYEADRFIWSLRKQAGFDPQILEGDEAHEFEPNLSRDFKCLAMLPDHGYIRDPGAYIADLAREVERLGGRILKANMKDFVLRDGRVHSIVTDEGAIECTHAVLATGAWSRSLSQKLGLSVPLETERGYHVEYSAPENGSKLPAYADKRKICGDAHGKGAALRGRSGIWRLAGRCIRSTAQADAQESQGNLPETVLQGGKHVVGSQACSVRQSAAHRGNPRIRHLHRIWSSPYRPDCRTQDRPDTGRTHHGPKSGNRSNPL